MWPNLRSVHPDLAKVLDKNIVLIDEATGKIIYLGPTGAT